MFPKSLRRVWLLFGMAAVMTVVSSPQSGPKEPALPDNAKQFVSEMVKHELEAEEESWLRRALEEHLHFTASPRASRLLSRRNGLPFVRVQPVHLQGSVGDTWAPVLAQLKPRESVIVTSHLPRIPQAAVHA